MTSPELVLFPKSLGTDRCMRMWIVGSTEQQRGGNFLPLFQELEQIPLFMTRSPEAVDPEKSPALAALQDIKYEDQTPRSMFSDIIITLP